VSMETITKPGGMHIGRKISRIRELRSMKQETMALELGVSQQTISRIESSEKIEDELLEQIAKILGIPAEGIKNFSEESMINYFNTFNEKVGQALFSPQYCTFNPIEKIVELYEDKVALLERLLESEKNKVELLKNHSSK